MLKCLCGNDLTLSKGEVMENDVIYKGNSDEAIGKVIGTETVCEKCKRKLTVQLSIYDNEWE